MGPAMKTGRGLDEDEEGAVNGVDRIRLMTAKGWFLGSRGSNLTCEGGDVRGIALVLRRVLSL